MLLIWGRRFYGKVHQAPEFYVATLFWHVFFFPLVPLGTYLVVEGSWQRLGSQTHFPLAFETNYGFQGIRLTMSLFSVLMGYFRGFLGLLVFAFGFAATIIPFIDPKQQIKFGSRDHLVVTALAIASLGMIAATRLLTRASESRRNELMARLRRIGQPAQVFDVSWHSSNRPSDG